MFRRTGTIINPIFVTNLSRKDITKEILQIWDQYKRPQDASVLSISSTLNFEPKYLLNTIMDYTNISCDILVVLSGSENKIEPIQLAINLKYIQRKILYNTDFVVIVPLIDSKKYFDSIRTNLVHL